MNFANHNRRYDIDWLRTLAFILLIFYHIGQFYVAGWDWHVKSAYQSEFLKNIMLLVNQWRMPLIFIISGLALALVEPKVGSWKLLKMRFVRVWIPLVIGMYLIVPPQLYYQLIQSYGFSGDYLEFMTFYVDSNTNMYPEQHHGPIGLLTWNHLWYLAYLWHYTLAYIMMKPLLLRVNWQALTTNMLTPMLVILSASLIVLYRMLIEPHFPSTNALVNDWFNHAYYFTMFLFGYVLAKSPDMWKKIINNRKLWLTMAAISYSLIIIRFNRVLGFDADYDQATLLIQIGIQFIWSANTVLWLLAIIGLAGAYLNKKHPLLTYMNQAVLPWYILHQTLIVVFAMWLATYELGPVFEPVLVILFTFTGCFIGYEIIRRFAIGRLIFGLKLNG